MRKWELTSLRPSWITVEVDGVVIDGREMKDIHAAFREHRIRTGARIEPGDEDKVWEAVKKAYPNFIIRNKRPAKPGLSINAAWSYVQFMLKRMRSGGHVGLEEARRRASICSSCPIRENVLGCSVCKQVLEMSFKPPQDLSRETPAGCGACGCYLPLKVWIPRDQLGPASNWPFAGPDASSGFPGCWMLE